LKICFKLGFPGFGESIVIGAAEKTHPVIEAAKDHQVFRVYFIQDVLKIRGVVDAGNFIPTEFKADADKINSSFSLRAGQK
jgi:hypothetical protein